jgi:hypothetical protein
MSPNPNMTIKLTLIPIPNLAWTPMTNLIMKPNQMPTPNQAPFPTPTPKALPTSLNKPHLNINKMNSTKVLITLSSFTVVPVLSFN